MAAQPKQIRYKMQNAPGYEMGACLWLEEHPLRRCKRTEIRPVMSKRFGGSGLPRSKENLLAKLREQADFLLASARGFYEGNSAESLRIAAHLRTLVHESGTNKPLLRQVRSDGLDLQILDNVGGTRQPGEEVFSFSVGLRVDKPAVFPSDDLESTNYKRCSIGAWWNRQVFAFWSQGQQGISKWMTYTRKQVILILANKEGGAHVDSEIDPAYAILLTDQPLHFQFDGIDVQTPDLAKFLAAQSGTEVLECLKHNFFLDLAVPPKWDVSAVPPISVTMDHISGTIVRVLPPTLPGPQIRITKRP